MWIKNCVAVGLASAFVEPIEATSIGGTVQQIRCLIDNVYAYEPGCVAIQKSFNYKMNIMMENILSMIYLHYMSDREDTAMWREQKNMPVPEYLKNLLDVWSERLPAYNDIDYTNYEMFHVQHFYHVAQGQKVINQKSATRLLENFRLREDAKNMYYNAKLGQTNHAKVDHFESLKQIQI
jgi:tryptophan halogenase